jgi:hypothetical protein
MTYKQVKEAVKTILESHAMIRDVRFATPTEWMKKETQPEYPVCCYAINTGSFEKGYKNFTVQFWFLDLAGAEGEYDVDVVSDQTEIANDIVGLLKQSHVRSWTIDETINFNCILQKFEDYISGVELTINLKTINKYDTCAIPTN